MAERKNRLQFVLSLKLDAEKSLEFTSRMFQ